MYIDAVFSEWTSILVYLLARTWAGQFPKFPQL